MTGEDFQRTVPRRHKRFLWQFQHFSRDCIAKEGICIEGMWSGSLILFFPLFFAPFFKCVYIVFLFSFWCRNDINENWFLMMIIFNVTSSGNNDNDEGNYSNNDRGKCKADMHIFFFSIGQRRTIFSFNLFITNCTGIINVYLLNEC